MEKIQFIFWELTKVLALIFLGLLSAKAVGTLRPQEGSRGPKWLGPLRCALYAAIVVLVVAGAWIAGYDIAAESYYSSSVANLEQHELGKAYSNAFEAVQLRPGVLRYWQQLAQVKLQAHQYASVIEDEAKIKQLNGGRLPEDDAVRLAASDLVLGRYHHVILITSGLQRANPSYAVPYLLRGQAYLALKDYPNAAKTFLAVLQIVPTLSPAVEGLAQAYYLQGEPARSLAVLAETEKFAFPPDARKHFQALKELYGQ
jgi:tetratricopeptide (TPR) repeat protein